MKKIKNILSKTLSNENLNYVLNCIEKEIINFEDVIQNYFNNLINDKAMNDKIDFILINIIALLDRFKIKDNDVQDILNEISLVVERSPELDASSNRLDTSSDYKYVLKAMDRAPYYN